MTMLEDTELLRRYAERQSEDAFAELVERHLNLVYSAALRQVDGDSHLAQDVTQSVFADLARKAGSLSRHTSINGWLYTSVHYTVTKNLRGDRRRRIREQEAHIMSEVNKSTDSSPGWEQLRPVIDEAMCKLPENDREAILLRYFESKPFNAIGTKLGLTENAARMRVERALEKLRGLLAARGIAASGAAIAAALAAQTVTAAPAGLAATITGTSIASAAASTAAQSGISNLFSMLKLKLVLPLAVGVAGIASLLLQHRTLAAVKDENAFLHAQVQQLARKSGELEAQAKAHASAEELERLRQQNLELLRLRSEVGRLRREAASRTIIASNQLAGAVIEEKKDEVPRQVHIRAEFITLPTDKLTLLRLPPKGQTYVVNDGEFKVLEKQISDMPEAKVLSKPSVVTISGRQAQMQTVSLEPATGDIVTTRASGPVLDVLPELDPDGLTVRLQVTATILNHEALNGNSSYAASTNESQTLVMRDQQTAVMTRSMPGGANSEALLVFLSPVMVDPAGNRLHSEEDFEKTATRAER